MYQWSQKTVGVTSQPVHTWTPGLCMSHSDVFGKTYQKSISRTKKIHISTYKMHFRVVVAVNLKSFTFCNSNIHVTQWQSHTVTFSVNECLDLPKVNISQKFKFWFWLWWHCRFWILINVCKLYKCKIISPNHPKILLGTNFH